MERVEFLYKFNSIQRPSAQNRRLYLYIDADTEGMVLLDEYPYHGVDELHREIPIYRDFRSITVVLSNRISLGNVLERPSFRSAYLIERDIRVYDLARALFALAKLYETIEDEDTRRYISRLINDTLNRVYIESIPIDLIEILSQEIAHRYSEYHAKLVARARDDIEIYRQIYVDLGLRQHDIERIGKQAGEAMEYLLEELSRLSKHLGKDGVLHAFAHSHIDYLWLWPSSIFKLKLGKTLSTSLTLLKAFPEMRFWITSVHYIYILKEKYPQLYEELKRCISEDRCILVGGFWTEYDANLIEGEALARQYLYGQRYLEKNFGKIARITFLPDTFGFPPTLPQLLKKVGIEVFIGRKLSWNEYNRFPYLYFVWRGIDGTEIPSIMFNQNHWGLAVDPKKLRDAWRTNTEKLVVPLAPYIYGYGDGGGGPTEEQLIQLEVYGRSPQLPKIVHGDIDEIVECIISNIDKLPRWFGELYLETHRGTYTVGIELKSLIHRNVVELKACEALMSMLILKGIDIGNTKKELENLWLRVLSHQFHDVLATTLSLDAYREAREVLEENLREIEELKHRLLEKIASIARGRGIIVVNRHPWKARYLLELTIPVDVASLEVNGKAVPIQVLSVEDSKKRILVDIELPPFGFVSLNYSDSSYRDEDTRSGVSVYEDKGGYVLENQYLRVTVDRYGEIKVFDKELGKEVVRHGNVMVVYEDRPRYWDAWNIDEDYTEGPHWIMRDVDSIKIVERGPLRACIEVVKRFRSSRAIQRICLERTSRLIWFYTSLDWRERHTLLKVYFYHGVNAHEVTVEVPLGNYARPIHKNTSWERAKFEMWYSRWLDVSEYDHGLSIINLSSVHGFDIDFGKIGLTLLKTPISPTPLLTSGRIEINYVLYPHLRTWREADTPRLAYLLDEKPLTIEVEGRGELDSYSFLRLDNPSIVVESVKPCEDHDDCVVIRAIEVLNSYTKTKLELYSGSIYRCFESDVLERNMHEVDCREIVFRPYEIKTLVVELR